MKIRKLFLLGVMCTLLAATSALADSRALSVLKQKPNSRFADLLVLQIFEQYGSFGAKVATAELESALQLPALQPAARHRARHLLATLKLMTGHPKDANHAIEQMGFLTRWQFAGPFPNESGTGLAESFIIDNDSPAPLPTAPNCTPSKSAGPCLFQSSWLSHRLGKVTMEPLFSSAKDICVVAQTHVAVPRTDNYHLWFGAGGQARVYVNNTRVLEDTQFDDADINRFHIPVRLEQGKESITVKVCSDESGTLSFYARFLDSNEQPVLPFNERAEFRPPVHTEVATAPKSASLLQLLKPAPKGPVRPAHNGYFAKYAHLTGAAKKDTAQRDAAFSACEELKSFEFCFTAAQLTLDVNEQRQAYMHVLEKDVENAEAKTKLLILDAAAPLYRNAQFDLIEASKRPDASDEVICAILNYYNIFLPETGRQLRKQLIGRPLSPLLAGCVADSQEGMPADVHTTTILKKALDSDFGNFDRHLQILRLSVDGIDKSVQQTLKSWQLIGAPPIETVLELAKLMDGASLTKPLIALLDDLHAKAPGVSEYRKFAGEFYIHRDKDRALTYLTGSLRQSPQDTQLRAYLSFLQPEDTLATPWLISPQTFTKKGHFCENRQEDCLLVNNTVIQVHENGLSSTVTQVVAYIATDDGARQWQQYSEQFSSTQTIQLLKARLFKTDGTIEQATGRATFPVSEPWYRLYYDIEAEVVELPRPAVGDVVEFQFRVDDIGQENMFGNYFGTIIPINSDIPVALFQFALIRPKTFPVYFELSTPVRRVDTKADDMDITVFTAQNLPAIPDEPDVPGAMSLVEYVHATSWQDWSQMESWYAELIRPQLKGDTSLKSLVQKLIRNRRNDRDKIAAVYSWVTTNIRYVGLEFGIHGYKPYSTSQVRARGFGDCKDTATLLVAMLNEAGIQAHVALVRTRSAGQIRMQHPSLSLFNHAIAYVPKYDLWLDGTATFHGVNDMPFEDQGIEALVIGVSPVKLRNTTVRDSAASTFIETETITIASDGSATINGTMSASGAPFAPWLRTTFATASDKQILEERFSERYPAIQMESSDFLNLKDLEKTPQIAFFARIPQLAKQNFGTLSFEVMPPMKLKPKFAPLQKRRHPLQVGPARTTELTIRYLVPHQYNAETPVNDARIVSDFGAYERRIRKTAGGLTVTRTFSLTKQVVEVSEYGDFLRFVLAVDAAERARITLHRKGEAK
ncbi:MAG: DUF3857 domain-containing protein [Deltaproteobacteria bacterium]|nr:DUF3857 domain-containing protein [Deltaproteobacteria bacterium]